MMDKNTYKVSSAYRAYADAIRGFIQAKTGCYHTAEDLTQETFIRLYRAEGLDQVNDIKSYLFRIANNLVVDHFRSAGSKASRHEVQDLSEENDLMLQSPSAEEITLYREQISQAFQIVGELSALCQRTFWLSRAHGFRNQEIANMQQICLSTVEKNISRATRHCVSKMTEQFA